MSVYRYSVCKIDSNTFFELKTIESKKELKLFLNEHKFEILHYSMDDRFRYIDEAKLFIDHVYHKDNSGDIIAIYDWLKCIWTDFWFL